MSESERTPTFWLQWINLKRGKMDTNQLKSSIKSILDRINSQKYKDDHDLLLLWIEYINLEILQNQPYSIINDLFKLLGRSNIGVNHSLLYTTWAKFECQSKHLEKAREILRVAIQSKVQPLNLLQDTLEYVNSIDGSDIPKENMHNVDLLKVTQGPNRRPLQEKLPRSVSLESHFSKRLEENQENTPNHSRSKPFTTESTPNYAADHSVTRLQSLRGKVGRTALGPPVRTKKDSPNGTKDFNGAFKQVNTSPKGVSDTVTPISPALSNASSSLASENPSQTSNQEEFEIEDMELSNTITMMKARSSNPIDTTLTQKNNQNQMEYMIPLKDGSDHKESKSFIVNGRPYLRSEVIGKGGSCKVYKVTDAKGQVYALKKVKLRNQDKSVIAGYTNEIILLNKLKNNDRIIKLIDAEHNHTDKVLMMVLEYGEIDLEQMLQKHPNSRLSLNFIRNYWEQMLQAVQAIHDQNIIHSDLKPANFLLVEGCLKLIDFGIAKAIPNDTTNIQRDHQTGTINYMAPEAINYVEIQGTKQNYLKQGRSSDVWSLGCILYRFIYLHPPFGNMTVMVKIKCITDPSHCIPYPETEDPQVIPILKGCLEYEPKKRLTIPELLSHPFLNPSVLDAFTISRILKRGLQLNLNSENLDSVVATILAESTSTLKK